MRTLLVLAAVVGAVACSAAPAATTPETEGQCYADALGAICDVDRLARLDPKDDPLGVELERWEYLGRTVENPDGIFFRTILQVEPPPERAKLLRHELAVAGVSRRACPLADHYESEDALSVWESGP